MFYTNKSRPAMNNSNRIKTNMSLTELVESSQNNNNNNNNKFKNNNFNNNKNNKNNKNNFKNNNNNFKNNKNNMFHTKQKIIEPEFKVNMEEFPVLLDTTTLINTIPTVNQNQKYSEKLKSIKVEQETYKMRMSKPQKEYKKKEIQDTTISEYYNPSMSLRILNSRQEYREELNEMLGDISPYWHKPSDEELSLLDEDELLISDNDDEYNNSIIEDW